ncbi:MAG: MarR family transcriptional regulator [Patescibacteria group bacterium]
MKKPAKSKEITLDDALLALRRAMTEALKDEAKNLGQSLAHFEVLKFVAESGNPTMKSLAAHLRITPPSASALVEGLVGKGFLSRESSAKDRRTVRITLTPKSHKLFVHLHKSKASIFKKMLSQLGKEDKKQLANLIAKCTNLKS